MIEYTQSSHTMQSQNRYLVVFFWLFQKNIYNAIFLAQEKQKKTTQCDLFFVSIDRKTRIFFQNNYSFSLAMTETLRPKILSWSVWFVSDIHKETIFPIQTIRSKSIHIDEEILNNIHAKRTGQNINNHLNTTIRGDNHTSSRSSRSAVLQRDHHFLGSFRWTIRYPRSHWIGDCHWSICQRTIKYV